jgi:hypothetical protein
MYLPLFSSLGAFAASDVELAAFCVITLPAPCSVTKQQVELLAVRASRGKWT